MADGKGGPDIGNGLNEAALAGLGDEDLGGAGGGSGGGTIAGAGEPSGGLLSSVGRNHGRAPRRQYRGRGGSARAAPTAAWLTRRPALARLPA
jgi:hypothetical protein